MVPRQEEEDTWCLAEASRSVDKPYGSARGRRSLLSARHRSVRSSPALCSGEETGQVVPCDSLL